MINFIILILCGSIKISVPKEFSGKVLSFLTFEKIRFFKQSSDKEGNIVFTLFYPHYKLFKSFCTENGCNYKAEKVSGIPRLFLKYKNRWGVYAGILFFVLIVWQSTQYVWSIDVTGNKTVPSREIIGNLEEIGFTYGTKFGKLDFDVLHNKYLSRFDDLCWISINMEGTHAHVEVRELLDFAKEDTGTIKNIVAAEAGTIVLVEAFEGRPMVSPGDKVAAGDLILSGVISVKDETVRYECSNGIVLAEVVRNFDVSIPKYKEKKIYTGNSEEQKELIFFKKHIKLSGNSGISYANYDKIEETKQICLFGDIQLPVFVEKSRSEEYTLTREAIRKTELDAAEKKEVSTALSEKLAGAELLEINSVSEETDKERVLHFTITCLADIAKPVTVGELPE